jgi:hypothetical protein
MITAAALMLSACNISIQDEIDGRNISKWPWFSIQSTIAFQKSIERPDGSLALITYDNAQMQRDIDDVGVYLYPNNTSCPPLGVTEPLTLNQEDGEAWWGRSDFFEKYRTHDVRDEDRSICNPPSPSGTTRKYVECEETDFDVNNCARKNRDYEIVNGMYSAYAFCAEKDGRAVAICIQQMTDDEQQAKEIFESFRWTN